MEAKEPKGPATFTPEQMAQVQRMIEEGKREVLKTMTTPPDQGPGWKPPGVLPTVKLYNKKTGSPIIVNESDKERYLKKGRYTASAPKKTV